jgi:RHS repeat-associated protein
MRRASLCVAFLYLIMPVIAFGQVQPGMPAFGTFDGNPDVLDLANLNSRLTVPVFRRAGRGRNFSYDLAQDSSVWYPAGSSGSQNWQPVGNWGWQGVTQVLTGDLTYLFIQIDSCFADNNRPYVKYYYFWYTDPFGSVTHQFYYSPGVSSDPYCGNITATIPSTDGSGYQLFVQIDYNGQIGNSVVTARDGTVAYPTIGQIYNYTGTGSVTDRNGNMISSDGSGHFTDTLGTVALTVAGQAPSPVTYTYASPNGSNASYTVKYAQYTVQTNFGCNGISEFGPTAENLVTEIDLPDQSNIPNDRYLISYEVTPGDNHSPHYVTGRIASITLPTSGMISYSYTGGSHGIVCADGTAATLTRQTPDEMWTYVHTESGSAWTTVVTDPQGNQTTYNFQGIYQTERKVVQGTTTLEDDVTCYNGNTSNCNTTTITLPITQRAVTRKLGNEQCKHVYFYNSSGLLTEQDDYDYGNGAPGVTPIRKELITYASLGNNIVDAPSQVKIENGSGTIVAQTTVTYDGSSVAAPPGATPQHVSVSGSRGNPTTLSYMVSGTANLIKSFTYFDTGNIQKAVDVNSASTTYEYPDATSTCGNAFPTKIDEPMGLTKSMTWKCPGGAVASSIDENGQTVSTAWNDPYFWRPATTTDQAGNQTTFSYPSPTTGESSMPFNGGSSVVDILQTLDSLGRIQVMQQREAPGSVNFDSVESDYDSIGRSSRTTVPYVAAANGTNGSAPATTQTYDALNRPLISTDGGGGTVTQTYTGNDVLQSIGPAPAGENPKRKQSEYNSIGQLTSICEITTLAGNGACAQTTAATGYWTKYAYDVLGNLLTVSQNAQSSTQSRTYTYDSVSRLTSETNPETGTITYAYDTDATCGTSKGDLVKSTDAAGNVTCFAYDQLHRVTSVTYPSGPNSGNTPSKHFVYDSATVNGVAMGNAKARLAEAYTCSTCSAKITDEGFSYTTRGEVSDVYESTPHSGGYYHAAATYWADGVINSLTASNGYATNYNLDGEGRVYSAGPGGNQLASTTYNAASEPTIITFASLDNDSLTYDNNTFRMRQYKYTVGATPRSVVGNLTWNASGTLGSLGITDPFNAANTQSCTYSYDDIARLASGNCGSVWSQAFSYDAFGNITKTGSEQFQPGYNYQTNQMATGASYDAMGDVVSDGLHSYAWDSDARPITIDTVTVTYDALGRMVEQGKSGAFTELQYSPTGFVMQLMNGQAWTKEFVPMPAGTEEVWQVSGASPYYRHADWLGSSRFASTYSTRAMYNDLAYAPFGETYAQAGSTGVTDISFAGNDEDTTTNLYDAQFREYGIQGRWPSPDPARIAAANPANPQSWNRYAYVLNNPLGSIDPSGLDCIYLTGTFGGMAASGPFGIDYFIEPGDCISPTDEGIYVDGQIAPGTLTLSADSNWLSWKTTDGMDGKYCVGDCSVSSVVQVNGTSYTDPNPLGLSSISSNAPTRDDYFQAISAELAPLNKLDDCAAQGVVNQMPFGDKVVGTPASPSDPIGSTLNVAGKLSDNKYPGGVVFALNKAGMPVLSEAAEHGLTKVVSHVSPYAKGISLAGWFWAGGKAAYDTAKCYNKPNP